MLRLKLQSDYVLIKLYFCIDIYCSPIIEGSDEDTRSTTNSSNGSSTLDHHSSLSVTQGINDQSNLKLLFFGGLHGSQNFPKNMSYSVSININENISQCHQSHLIRKLPGASHHMGESLGKRAGAQVSLHKIFENIPFNPS